MYSGGLASWAEAKLVVERYGKENTLLLFSDTGQEHPDLYRFLHEGADNIGLPLVIVKAPYKNIFDLARKQRALPNNRMPFCSVKMKHEPAVAYIQSLNVKPTVHFGIYADESHRLAKISQRWANMATIDSLLMKSLMTQNDIQKMLDDNNLKRPALYDMGFAHNNCGGGCVRAGKSQWIFLQSANPQLYAQWEELEDEISAIHGSKHTILKSVSLRELREQSAVVLDINDSAGCGCFLDD